VGKSLFLCHRNSREVCQELTQRNIKISPREVDYLGKRFIFFLLTIDYLATHCFGFPAEGRRLALFFQIAPPENRRIYHFAFLILSFIIHQ